MIKSHLHDKWGLNWLNISMRRQVQEFPFSHFGKHRDKELRNVSLATTRGGRSRTHME